MDTKRYFIISPDGFSIHFENDHGTPEEAWNEFHQWKERFRRQGFYSTIKDGERFRIPLDKLDQYCSLGERNP